MPFYSDSRVNGSASGQRFCPNVTFCLVLVYIASALERTDEALLPAVYKEIGQDFRVTPAELGILDFVRNIAQAVGGPIAAILAISHNRVRIVAISATLWGAATLGIGLATSFWVLALCRGLNGAALAALVPSLQSLVADTTPGSARGVAFGWLQFASYGGALWAELLGTTLAQYHHVFGGSSGTGDDSPGGSGGGGTVVSGRGGGVGPGSGGRGGGDGGGLPGWRLAFFITAVLSWVLAAALWIQGRTPVDAQDGVLSEGIKLRSRLGADVAQFAAHARAISRIPTFFAVMLQGLVNSVAWGALVFLTLWLELLGYSHSIAGLLYLAFTVGVAAGGLFGGWLGDFAARKWPAGGRVLCGQVTNFLGVPAAILLLLVVPRSTHYSAFHAAALFNLGFSVSWGDPATNNPIFADIVPPRMRTTVYALDRSVEFSAQALGAPVVGLLAEKWYGYLTPEGQARHADKQKVVALGHGLTSTMVFPFLLCALLNGVLYCTYPKDREKAARVTSEEAEEQSKQRALMMAVMNGQPLESIQNHDVYAVRSSDRDESMRPLVNGEQEWAEGRHEAEESNGLLHVSLSGEWPRK